jgi:hypothetical protein
VLGAASLPRPVVEGYSMDGNPSYVGVNRAISQQVTLSECNAPELSKAALHL